MPKVDPRWVPRPEDDKGKPEPWVCSSCGKIREAYWNVWEGQWHLDTSPCEHCSAAEFAEQSLKQARENTLRKYGLLDGVYAGMTLSSYIPDPRYPSQAIAKQVAQEVIADWRAGEWSRGMILAGTDVGVGKTHLAIATAREGVEMYPRAGERILAVWGAPDLLTKIKDSYNDGGPEQLMETVTESGIVVLDDIGVEHFSKETWYQEIMYQIFNARWIDQRATIVTTNMTRASMRKRLGERTYSRMISIVSRPVYMSGEDYRTKNNGSVGEG